MSTMLADTFKATTVVRQDQNSVSVHVDSNGFKSVGNVRVPATASQSERHVRGLKGYLGDYAAARAIDSYGSTVVWEVTL